VSEQPIRESQSDPPEEYEPPVVEDILAEDRPAVTAAGDQQQDDIPGAEWRP
jgi:hypothetical protein